MSRDGSGTFSRKSDDNTGSTTWQLDDADGIEILSASHDTHDEDIADGLTESIAKTGVTTPTANLPMGGYKHTNTATASARTDYARASQVQDSALMWGGTAGGAGTSYTITLTPAITAYAAGQRVAFIANAGNSAGAVNIDINSVGSSNILHDDGTELTADEIAANQLVEIMHDGTNWVLINPAVPRLPNGVAMQGETALGGSSYDLISLTSSNNVVVGTSSTDNTYLVGGNVYLYGNSSVNVTGFASQTQDAYISIQIGDSWSGGWATAETNWFKTANWGGSPAHSHNITAKNMAFSGASGKITATHAGDYEITVMFCNQVQNLNNSTLRVVRNGASDIFDEALDLGQGAYNGGASVNEQSGGVFHMFTTLTASGTLQFLMTNNVGAMGNPGTTISIKRIA